jgi:N-acetylglucosaminyldiphosphoundecaprenol N-acetyl-beta-D-mannosaminyltransferase
VTSGRELQPTASAKLLQYTIFGTSVHAMTRESVWTSIVAFHQQRSPRHIVTVNVDFLELATQHQRLQEIINSADLSVPDGIPLVWTARYLGLSESERVTGSDLIEFAAKLSMENGARIFLLGGPEGSALRATERLEQLYPGAVVCGHYSPPHSSYPFPPDIDEEICKRIKEAEPDFLFVAFGCPKQEFWISDHLDRIGSPVCVGVGGAFSFISGEISRAPSQMQRLGLEWVYRLWKEPRRLWHRYLLKDLPFMMKVVAREVASRTGIGQRPLDASKAEAAS